MLRLLKRPDKEDLEGHKKRPPTPGSYGSGWKKRQFFLKDADYEKMREFCGRSGISMTEFITKCVMKGIREGEKNHGKDN